MKTKNSQHRWLQDENDRIEPTSTDQRQLLTTKPNAKQGPVESVVSNDKMDRFKSPTTDWASPEDLNKKLWLKSLSNTEAKYSNIERECLAVLFGLGKFQYYIHGRHTLVETDHSPLEQVFKKNIAEAPARLQRMLSRCLKFDIQVQYKRGVAIPVADDLSRISVKGEIPVKQERAY